MAKTRLALLWHMHQPLYREAESSDYLMPWVRLHAARAYNDMAFALERHEGVRCTVNFTPVLLEQLEDYARGFARDRFLDLSVRSPADLGADERRAILTSFFMVSWEQSVRPAPRYWDLLQKRGRDIRQIDLDREARRFGDAELRDLQALFNLAWMGFAALEEDAGLRELVRKGRDYTGEDVAYVIAAQRRIVEGVVARWRRLAERGQVELSTTPYHHPILPLVCDSDSAAQALPGVPLPPRFAHPEDARWHVREALASHARRFGRAPAGMWPAEGAVSPEALGVLAAEGVTWAASDEGVLLRSLPAEGPRLASVYRPWRVEAGGGREIAMLFRDRGLADLVGFTYAKTPAAEAVADFAGRIASIGEAWRTARLSGTPTVGVFLDGENAWEHYPASGREFLDRLYRALETSPEVQTVTMSEAVADAAPPAIARIHSGSWIEASYRIWIGHREDRLAWTALGRAREAVEAAERAGTATPEARERARRHLYAAEGSDWYWWYGEEFSTELAAEFDSLFRGHVVKACELVEVVPPFEALQPIKRAGASSGLETKPLREPTGFIQPVLDGRDPTFFEWQAAGLYRPGQHRGSMFGAAQAFHHLYYGFDVKHLYLRLDPAETPQRTAEVASRIRLMVLGADRQLRVDFDFAPDGALRTGRLDGAEVGRSTFRDVLELAVPFAALGLAAGNDLAFAVLVLRGEVEVERLPRHGFLTLTVPSDDFERVHWRV